MTNSTVPVGLRSRIAPTASVVPKPLAARLNGSSSRSMAKKYWRKNSPNFSNSIETERAPGDSNAASGASSCGPPRAKQTKPSRPSQALTPTAPSTHQQFSAIDPFYSRISVRRSKNAKANRNLSIRYTQLGSAGRAFALLHRDATMCHTRQT